MSERLQINGRDRLEVTLCEADDHRWAIVTTWGCDCVVQASGVEVKDLLEWWRKVGRLLEGKR